MSMTKNIVFLLIVAATASFAHPIENDENDVHLNEVEPDPEMEKYLREALENFREQMKEGISAIHVPVLDPLELRNLDINVNENLATMSLSIKEITVEDLSTFEVPYINADLETFYLNLKLDIPRVHANGRYYLDGKLLKIFPLTGDGSFSINLTKAEITASTKLDAMDGTLQANKLELDLSWNKLEIYLENFLDGGKFSNVLQKMLPNIGKNIFDNFKPSILSSLNTLLKNALNHELRKPEVRKIVEGLIQNSITE